MAKLPQRNQVWERVCDFAERCKHDKRKLYTLAKFVANRIVEVDFHGGKIRRHSVEGRRQTAHITQRHVEGVWDQLTKHHVATTIGHPRVFTHALMVHALPEHIQPISCNTIRLLTGSSRTSTRLPTFAHDEVGYDVPPGRRGGGEGPVHRALRLYIFEDPDNALANLEGGPWNRCATEKELETQDRIDVVLRDNDGNYTLIEVKPGLVIDRNYPQIHSRGRPAAIAPYAQAAKYRAQWNVLYDTPLDRIRCVVAAPSIPRETWYREMFRRHEIESVAVQLPPERVPLSYKKSG